MKSWSWFKTLPAQCLRFPWRAAALTLRERLREDRLALSAGSLTFTTTMALVPFLTLALALFTAFPMFAQLQEVLQKWLVDSLVPPNISRQVLGYLSLFAGKASRLGVLGLLALVSAAWALVFTIDRTLNSIWRVNRLRPIGQRVLIYWAALTLGPLLLGASLTLTSYLVSASRGLVTALPGTVRLLFDVLEFGVLAAGVAALFHHVPNTRVRWSHAWLGGVFVATGIELAKKGVTLYISSIPTYAMVYGAFAALPILLLWIYLAWLIVLLGAVITAHLPSLLAGLPHQARRQGAQFQLAVGVLQQLHRSQPPQGPVLTQGQLARQLKVDPLGLEPVMDVLLTLEWIGRITPAQAEQDDGFVLLVDAQQTKLEPLIGQLLLDPQPALGAFWRQARFAELRLVDLI